MQLFAQVLGTLAALEGELSFWNNQHHSEGFSGAIYLSSFGQIILHENVTISFINNTGKYAEYVAKNFCGEKKLLL